MKKLKSIELQNGQTLQSIIEEAKKMGVKDFTKVIIDVDSYIEYIPYSSQEDSGYACHDIKLKKVK